MKKLVLLIATFISIAGFSQNIYLDQEIIIPIGAGPGGEKLDSIQIVSPVDGFNYTLAAKYNANNEIEQFYTKWVTVDDSVTEGVSLTITLNKISNTQRSAVLEVMEDGVENHVDSTVINYNLAGLETSMYSCTQDSTGYTLRDSMIWYDLAADVFYSVEGPTDSVFYTATNGKMILATVVQHGESEK